MDGVHRGEVGRRCVPGYIGVARGVHGDAGASVVAAAGHVSGVTQHRINDQRLGTVVGGQFERDS